MNKENNNVNTEKELEINIEYIPDEFFYNSCACMSIGEVMRACSCGLMSNSEDNCQLWIEE
jgi:hypothetical protein